MSVLRGSKIFFVLGYIIAYNVQCIEVVRSPSTICAHTVVNDVAAADETFRCWLAGANLIGHDSLTKRRTIHIE